MKTNIALIITLGTCVLAGCSSTPTDVNKGTIKASTFEFIDPGARSAPAFVDNRATVHSMVQQAIAKNLGERGLHRAPAPGQSDITVAYMIVVGNNGTTTGLNEYFGYGRDAYELQEIAHEKYTHSKNPNYFEAGTLLVDLIDTKTYKLLWRGHRTRPLQGDVAPDIRAAQLQKDVDQLLSKVRFAGS